MMRRAGVMVLGLVLGSGTAFVPAEAADPGLTVLPFLKLGAGARPASMGDAYSAVVTDATATYWNPAGLLRIERNDVLGSHNSWIQDLRQEFVGFGARRGRHALGFAFNGLYTDDIESRDPAGNPIGHFGYSDNAFSVSYAFQATHDFGLGGTARYVRESIVGTIDGDFVLSGFAFDLGGTWSTPVPGVTAAAVLSNLGGKMSYDFEGAGDFDLPTALRLGIAYHRTDLSVGGVTLAADVAAVRGDDATLHLGAEYAYRNRFLVDAGYQSGLENQNVSFGLGYSHKVDFHYAFVPVYDDLGNSHRLSLGYAW